MILTVQLGHPRENYSKFSMQWKQSNKVLSVLDFDLPIMLSSAVWKDYHQN